MSKIHEVSLKLKEEDYEMLFKLKKREREKLIKNIFDSGYNLYFPSTDKELNQQQEVLALLQSLKNDFSTPDIGDKIDSLESSLGKLIGLSSNSSRKGEVAENLLENLIITRYGDIQYKDTSKIAHSGDAWLTFPDNGIVMLESKNYTTTINKDEIDKMERDMKEHNILWGIFISWNSNIQGKREFDMHIFSHQGNNYVVIMLSNLSKDTSRLDLGIQVLRNLRKNYSDLSKFPWIVSNIKDDLDEFNNIINLNYSLLDGYEETEKSIKNSLSVFYNKLREYQYKLNKKSKDILDKINSTMEKSINNPLEDINNKIDFLENHKSKKIFNTLTKIFDEMPKLKWIPDIEELEDKNEFYINKLDDNNELYQIAKVKIYLKKVSITILKLNIIFDMRELNGDNNISDVFDAIISINTLV